MTPDKEQAQLFIDVHIRVGSPNDLIKPAHASMCLCCITPFADVRIGELERLV